MYKPKIQYFNVTKSLFFIFIFLLLIYDMILSLNYLIDDTFLVIVCNGYSALKNRLHDQLLQFHAKE